MAKGQVTSRQLVEQYLIRIATYEDRLNATLAVNPKALEEADALDRERAQGKLRGPLHGIPVALKDNIHTTNMPTTGGALAFAGYVPPYEATLTRNLKAAGAIIIAKTGLTELANWVAGNPNAMPGNYNAVGGFAFNPYDPRPDPRPEPGDGRPVLQTGGSSSGVGTAANFWAGNVGSDTGGSVISPSNANMLVGIRPTIGRISRYGVIPITADHDTAGPMTKTVADAAIMLGAMEGAAPDPNDAATRTCTPPPNRDYTKFLNAGGLKGARIGVPRAFYIDRVTLPGEKAPRGGVNAEQAKVDGRGDRRPEAAGRDHRRSRRHAELRRHRRERQLSVVGFLFGRGTREGQGQRLLVGFKYGMKRDYNAWLASLGPSAPVKTLTEHRNWNVAHAKAGAIKYGQSRFDISDEIDLVADKARLRGRRCEGSSAEPRPGDRRRAEGVQARRLHHARRQSGAGVASRAGYPIIAVPFGMVPNAPQHAAVPAGFNAKPAPFGVGFVGAQCSEPKLIEIAVRLRTGDEASHRAAGHPLREFPRRGSFSPRCRARLRYLLGKLAGTTRAVACSGGLLRCD